MLAYILLIGAILYSAEAVASCTRNAELLVYQQTVQQEGITYEKAVVNKSAPVQAMFEIRANSLQSDSVSWLHNNEPIKIDEKTSQEVYYTVETLQDIILVGLHFRSPSARVTGNWTLILQTADGQEHRALCFVTSPPVLRPRLGAVRGHEGKPLAVTCDTDSYPPPSRVVWQRLEEKDGKTRLVPVVNATFKEHNGVAGAMMEWADATDYHGFYLCKALSSRGSDSSLVEVRIKGLKTILWPAIGILLQLVILVIIIVIYERAQAKRRKAEEEQSGNPKTK